MIEIKNITKIFNENTKREFTAIKDISFTIKSKDIFFINGVSGSGKSTLLSIIAGLYKPTMGEVIIDGESISKLSLKFASEYRRKKIGIIFQNFNLIPTFNVLDNILIPTIVDKVSRSEFAKELLAKFELSDKAKTMVAHLSGGEQQRVAIIRALINNPDIILADEPTANLDKTLSLKLLEYLKKMKQDGKTIVVSTHDPFLLESGLADDCFEIKKG